jgi:hypothetical protein
MMNFCIGFDFMVLEKYLNLQEMVFKRNYVKFSLDILFVKNFVTVEFVKTLSLSHFYETLSVEIMRKSGSRLP